MRRLHLDRTAISDSGLKHLAPLTHLESLNLHATKISDKGLLALQNLPRLRSVYLWQSKVTPAGVEKLAKAQTDQAKISRWKTQIADLEANIRAEHFKADVGSPLQSMPAAKNEPLPMPPLPSPATAVKPAETEINGKEASIAPMAVNTTCPVSGEAMQKIVAGVLATPQAILDRAKPLLE